MLSWVLIKVLLADFRVLHGEDVAVEGRVLARILFVSSLVVRNLLRSECLDSCTDLCELSLTSQFGFGIRFFVQVARVASFASVEGVTSLGEIDVRVLAYLTRHGFDSVDRNVTCHECSAIEPAAAVATVHEFRSLVVLLNQIARLSSMP